MESLCILFTRLTILGSPGHPDIEIDINKNTKVNIMQSKQNHLYGTIYILCNVRWWGSSKSRLIHYNPGWEGVVYLLHYYHWERKRKSPFSGGTPTFLQNLPGEGVFFFWEVFPHKQREGNTIFFDALKQNPGSYVGNLDEHTGSFSIVIIYVHPPPFPGNSSHMIF